MLHRTRKLVSAILLFMFAMSFSAAAADTSIQSSNTYKYAIATLSDSSGQMVLDLKARTTQSNSQIGSSKITVHDLTTGSTKNYSGSYSSGISYSKQFSLPNAVKGHRYYAVVTFYADGLSTQATSNTITF
ncbi:MAG: hypothetical protein ACLTWR_05435 [Agathobaculum desmolans]|uniref:hypothetical protein n=1 Tax=Agathobaculum desmolans TaxID=39484 RepID=UPI00399546FA